MATKKTVKPGQVDGAVVDGEFVKRIVIETPKEAEFEVVIEGQSGSPLVVHNLFTKGNREMMERRGNAEKTSQKGKKRNPQQEFEEARYMTVDGRDGFPSHGIKKAMVSAVAHSNADVKPYILRRIFFVNVGQRLTPIEAKPPTMRTDIVRLAGAQRAPDLRYRPEYTGWRMKLRILYNPAVLDPKTLVNLLNLAGRWVGLGENRPEKSGGDWGLFHVVESAA